MNITIDFTNSDLEDLMNGQEFDWTYTSDTGDKVDVHLFNEDWKS